MRPLLSTVLFILAGLAAAAAIGFYPAFVGEPVVQDDEQTGFDKTLVMKFSHVVAENTPKGLAAQKFADLVKEKTSGRVSVEVFPNGVLYTEKDEVDALMRGDIQLIAPAFANISERVPAWELFDLPYAFLSEEAVEEAFAGEIGRILFKKLESSNMAGLAYWSNGFKQMTSNRGPLVRPEDFRGQRFRILPSKVIEAQFTLFGARTIAIPFNDVYRGYETGIADGGENTISNIYTKRFYKVQQYMTISNHGYLGYGVLTNKKYWDKLPESVRKAVKEAIDETSAWANRNAIQMNQAQLDDIRTHSTIQLHLLTSSERAEWMQAWDPLYRQFERTIGRELIEEVRRLQQKYGG
ncbi:C4-dicarboxylate-binding periplasmic protein DctP [Paenibacillus solanacearum]|uniref:C4-dicarboxylate-binding periplasmic protein DctP n=1 Tax=Paenibacillus solanacearum TaxID=2048548 RepID=A0A916K1P4_9BACL|nr:DctP family TRAP transporter solute-binding subunit [Paenibacillus solanacearum]CAG7615316.1 C4-dicarboxylate-binding periplasmic protein DctP [Paenibacillus solanacearum]